MRIHSQTPRPSVDDSSVRVDLVRYSATPTSEDERERRIAEELATTFYERSDAIALLRAAGFPTSQIPHCSTPLIFWIEVVRKASDGMLAGGVHTILDKAATLHGSNSALSTGIRTMITPRTWRGRFRLSTPAMALGALTGALIYGWFAHETCNEAKVIHHQFSRATRVRTSHHQDKGGLSDTVARLKEELQTPPSTGSKDTVGSDPDRSLRSTPLQVPSHHISVELKVIRPYGELLRSSTGVWIVFHDQQATVLEHQQRYDLAAEHRIAQLAYSLVSRRFGDASNAVVKLTGTRSRATQTSTAWKMPQLTAVLEHDDFLPLGHYLSYHDVPLEELEGLIAKLVA